MHIETIPQTVRVRPFNLKRTDFWTIAAKSSLSSRQPSGFPLRRRAPLQRPPTAPVAYLLRLRLVTSLPHQNTGGVKSSLPGTKWRRRLRPDYRERCIQTLLRNNEIMGPARDELSTPTMDAGNRATGLING